MRFLFRELRHGFPQALVDNPVIGIGQNRLESALDFVLPLRARVEARQPCLNTVLDATVIAGLEMQELKFYEAAPVAPLQGDIPLKKKRRRDGLLVPFRDDHDRHLPQRRAGLGKKSFREIAAVS